MIGHFWSWSILLGSDRSAVLHYDYWRYCHDNKLVLQFTDNFFLWSYTSGAASVPHRWVSSTRQIVFALSNINIFTSASHSFGHYFLFGHFLFKLSFIRLFCSLFRLCLRSSWTIILPAKSSKMHNNVFHGYWVISVQVISIHLLGYPLLHPF